MLVGVTVEAVEVVLGAAAVLVVGGSRRTAWAARRWPAGWRRAPRRGRGGCRRRRRGAGRAPPQQLVAAGEVAAEPVAEVGVEQLADLAEAVAGVVVDPGPSMIASVSTPDELDRDGRVGRPRRPGSRRPGRPRCAACCSTTCSSGPGCGTGSCRGSAPPAASAVRFLSGSTPGTRADSSRVLTSRSSLSKRWSRRAISGSVGPLAVVLEVGRAAPPASAAACLW